ncbi:DUF6113 family protein [Spongiactinospora sp. TRM90649]|uniref:DUF6113 family protein n=1 Tax=Spongiactinospora sp. TRM90649 TaxID=3031114 RepID=UPI0023F81B7C|nr:DUF6113 family protein [Spongiactinospora sp. TRM90649]MDF5754643.1 DUF6113 family protein [Spongiactinospora sp. TRM90649]
MGETSGKPIRATSSQVEPPDDAAFRPESEPAEAAGTAEAGAEAAAGEEREPPRELPAWVTGVVFAIFGVLLGVVGGFLHNAYALADVPFVSVAWVLVLAGLVHLTGRLTGGRLVPLVITAVWIAVSLVLSGRRVEGDLVIAANAAGYVYLYGGFVAMLIAALLVPSRGPSWLLRYGAGGPSGPQSGA